jgi:hypothetical protein
MRAVWIVLACAAAAESTVAQTRPEPRLLVSFYGGVARYGNLWEIPKQPLLLVFGQPQWDTLRLERTLTTAPMVGLNVTYYRSSHLGLTADIVYLGLRIDDTCDPLYLYTDAQNRNLQLCNNVTQSTRTVSNVGFSAGVAYRLSSRGPVTPYARLQAGLSVRSSSLVEVVGVYAAQDATGVIQNYSRAIIEDLQPTSTHPMGAAAIGITFAFSPAYQLRAEVRDHLIVLERPTGPADDRRRAPTENFLGHAPALVFGFDIVLEKSRGRRY